MAKTFKKVTVLAVAAVMGATVVGAAACGGGDDGASSGKYTYTAATTALATNWNTHTWETNADQEVLTFIESPLVDLTILDSEEGTYQWVYEMATSVTDVTAQHQSDLTKYGVYLPDGQTASQTTEGYVYEIKLREGATWQNGEPITADDYVYSMQQMLNPKMKNYRANLYISGEAAIAGGYNYYYSQTPIYDPVVPAYGAGETPDYSFDLNSQPVYINLDIAMDNYSGYSFALIKDYGYIADVEKPVLDENGKPVLGEDGEPLNQFIPGATYYAELKTEANQFGYIQVTEENKEKVIVIMDQFLSAFKMSVYNKDGSVNKELFMEFLYYYTGEISDAVDWNTVGLYKVDDYTIRYVLNTYLNRNYFMTNLTSNWIVYEELYEAGRTTIGQLETTTYGTSVATTMAYGPYKISSIDNNRQMRLTQNENWFGYERDENGNLVSYTEFEVDGKRQRQYMTTDIVIEVMTEDTMRQAFMSGQISEWSPAADEISEFNTSEYMYSIDETYTLSLFFNTNSDVLAKLDETGTNTNGKVLTSEKFRKAMGLAINRQQFVTSTPGYAAEYSLMNDLYYYDIYNDPSSSYRSSEPAMEAICKLYGVKYGEGQPYATLEEAYNSINGYNLTQAQQLFKEACNELVAAGLYKKGDAIHFDIAWSAGALTSDDNAQIAALQTMLNAALKDTGFGTITLEAIGNLNDRYGDVSNGTYAIGYGAWGGAAFYPFRNFQVYMDPDQYEINEAGCWDPTTEKLTLSIDADQDGTPEEYTMTWQAWSNSMTGTGQFAQSPFEVQLEITAQLEYEFLNKYYRIPLCSTTQCFLLSQQIKYYTETYNIMYSFGGFRLMTYNYNDADWSAYVSSQGGTLNYV